MRLDADAERPFLPPAPGSSPFFSATPSIRPYSFASREDMNLSRLVSCAMRSMDCPVFAARISFRRSFRRSASFTWISMSVACPWAPPESWWIMMREFGRAKRLPFVPAASRNAPMLAAWPTHVVQMSGFTNCIVS